MKQYAVVTGASQGLGKSFALELARKGINLILISLPDQDLGELSEQLKTDYHIDVVYFERDVSVTENILELTEKINANYDVFFLVNNVGVGGTKRMTDADISYITNIIKVNVTATSVFTHQLLPNLLKQENGYILNISSLAALGSLPYKTVYPASKAFIHTFSRGLNQELKDTNVSVSVVNPGAMPTNKNQCERLDKLGYLGKLTLKKPHKVARKCVKNAFKKEKVIVVNHLSWFVLGYVPRWIRMPLMARAIKKDLEQ